MVIFLFTVMLIWCRNKKVYLKIKFTIETLTSFPPYGSTQFCSIWPFQLVRSCQKESVYRYVPLKWVYAANVGTKETGTKNVLHALEIPSTCDPCMHVRVPSADILRSRVLQSSYVKFKLDSVYHSKYTCLFVGCAGRMAISSPCRTRLSFYVTSYTERARIGEQVQTHSAISRETCSWQSLVKISRYSSRFLKLYFNN